MGVIPGPGVVAIVGYALGSGRRTALASVAGIALGNGVAMILSLMGAGALRASSARAFLSRPRAALWPKRASGATLIAAGVATAAARR